MCSTMVIAALFLIASYWEQPRCPSTEDTANVVIYTMEYYSSIKSKDIMNFAEKWMKLETIILSEVVQTQKDMHVIDLLINRC